MTVRIVSLVPSSTETLLALGADVVACTRFCEQPQIRQVGGTKNPDIEAIVTLEPDLVVMDREENRIEDHDALASRGVEVWVSDVRSVDDALSFVGDLCARLGIEPPAAIGPVEPIGGPVRRAFVPIWRRPWMSISDATYGGSVLRAVGVELVTAGSDVPYPVVELDRIASLAPDLVLVPSEPYDFEARHLDELAVAMPGVPIVRVDGQDLFWWGIRTPAAIGRLAEALQQSGTVGRDDPPPVGE
ncbi:MAG TPA: helical backbone metal receptor [Ilumatobacteraceae bacterium]|nr:helical backbone metal receptor [Ilumatobacteraceae bacterium]